MFSRCIAGFISLQTGHFNKKLIGFGNRSSNQGIRLITKFVLFTNIYF